MDQYAVVGNPISHSKSPEIHAQFAKQTGQVLQYSAILGEAGQFARVVKNFQQKNGKGMNVTVPFKRDAWELVDERKPRAKKAGAVNTILIEDDGRLIGDNTDGTGLVVDIVQNLKFEIKDKRILILGAGGAVRGVLGPVLAKQPARVVVANRTKSKADELALLFSDEGDISSSGFDVMVDEHFDLIINGTAASLSGAVPAIRDSLIAGCACYDMMYAERDTAFMRWAKQRDASFVWDGLGMLVEQAAESFYLWRNIRPDTGRVIAHLRTPSKS
ncbi:MAG TPA: shikimate dehydrogenase [Gammaproteobacteria bacterium]|nr:shikimate dehydrogenase [Gammaproteobacteria bacterium]